MPISRRSIVMALATTALAGCAGGRVPRLPSAPAPDPSLQPVANAGFDAWVDAIRGRARAQGISDSTIDIAFRDAGFLPGVIERDRNQTEFTRSLEDYLAIAASDVRVATGRDMMRRHAKLLSEIEARYGVDAEIVTAIWGLESRYGARRGDIPVISAVATLAYDGRRGAFFEQQLVAALRIIENGDVSAEGLTGSWAGAMGHTQFIPTSYLAYAVDFRGDGKRDIWSEDPTDSLASAAAYLAQSGWRRGQRWGLEVQLPEGFDYRLAGRGTTRSAAFWTSLGVRGMTGGALPEYGEASILIPAGAAGPAFAVFRNFTVITRYNNAVNYVLGVGHLADRIAGGPPLQTSFPPDEQGMTISDRRELQRRLTAAGFDTQGTDGVIGPDTRSAIAAFQSATGRPPDGEPSLALLRTLR